MEQNRETFEFGEKMIKDSIRKAMHRLAVMIQIRLKCDYKTAMDEVEGFMAETIKEEKIT